MAESVHVDAGIFRLVDPPSRARAETIRDTIAEIDYPWRRCLRATWADPDGAILVRWTDMPQGTTGQFRGSVYEIKLKDSDSDYVVRQEPFVFAHEAGHMVDAATLDGGTKRKLMELYHRDVADGPWYGKEDPNEPGKPFVWSHQADHAEWWRASANDYAHRINEAFADSFVAAFAPRIWDGTHPTLPGSEHYPRFAHWTKDLEAIRRLTLERPMAVYDDVDPDDVHAENIERAAELGLLSGKGGGIFDPSAPVTRAQLASVVVRLHDRLLTESDDTGT